MEMGCARLNKGWHMRSYCFDCVDSKYSGAAVQTDIQPDSDPAEEEEPLCKFLIQYLKNTSVLISKIL